MERDSITQAIGAAIQVPTELGPGLLKSTYEVCPAYELASRGLDALRQVPLPVTYKGVHLDTGIVEVKAVEEPAAPPQAQPLTDLKLSGHEKNQARLITVGAITKPLCPWCAPW